MGERATTSHPSAYVDAPYLVRQPRPSVSETKLEEMVSPEAELAHTRATEFVEPALAASSVEPVESWPALAAKQDAV
jgi:hypothetical protein